MNLVSNPARDFLKVAAPYFQSRIGGTRGVCSPVSCSSNALVYLFVLNNEWYVLFYNSLQDRNWNAFLLSLVVFLGLATAMVVLVGAQYFLGQSLMIRWREWMTRRYLENWLAQSRLYRGRAIGHGSGGARPSRQSSARRGRLASRIVRRRTTARRWRAHCCDPKVSSWMSRSRRSTRPAVANCSRFVERLPQTIIVTVGRRPVIGPLHERIIELKKAARAQLVARRAVF